MFPDSDMKLVDTVQSGYGPYVLFELFINDLCTDQ